MKMLLGERLADALRPFHFRGKARLVELVCPREGERVADVFGYKTKLDLGDLMQRKIYFHAFEPRETERVRAFLKPGMTFVDVGANIGYYTFLAASCVGSSAGQVLAFEPSPYAVGRLTDAVRTNHIPHIRIFPVALGAEPAELPLYVPLRPGNHSPTMLANAGGKPVNVTVRRLDDCLREASVDRVELLKVDVEGFEPDVLRGAGDFLARKKIRAVLCEFNAFWLHRNGSSAEELYDLLLSFGYRSSGGKADLARGEENLFFTSAP
jgi:FkbM family methyltransferase